MKPTTLRKNLLFLLLFAILSCVFLSSCSATSRFVGTYESTFVDSQNDEENISFKLVIKKDETFTLTRYINDKKTKLTGYCKSYTESGSKELLCVVEDGYSWNSNHPNAWNPYFIISKLDDGTLMAAAGTTSSNTSVATAFGSGEITKITLVLFEED